jgi:hypothetical protein
MILVFILEFLIVLFISLLWARGIDNMPKDYKGEDFLNWDEDIEK